MLIHSRPLTELGLAAQRIVRADVVRVFDYQCSGELRGGIMKSFMTFVGTLCLAAVWVLLVPETSALALPLHLPKASNS